MRDIHTGKETQDMAEYDPVAVNRQIETDRRRTRISAREAKAIHAALKGSSGYRARKGAEEAR